MGEAASGSPGGHMSATAGAATAAVEGLPRATPAVRLMAQGSGEAGRERRPALSSSAAAVGSTRTPSFVDTLAAAAAKVSGAEVATATADTAAFHPSSAGRISVQKEEEEEKEEVEDEEEEEDEEVGEEVEGEEEEEGDGSWSAGAPPAQSTSGSPSPVTKPMPAAPWGSFGSAAPVPVTPCTPLVAAAAATAIATTPAKAINFRTAAGAAPSATKRGGFGVPAVPLFPATPQTLPPSPACPFTPGTAEGVPSASPSSYFSSSLPKLSSSLSAVTPEALPPRRQTLAQALAEGQASLAS